MNYLSVCSGIEAASVAREPLGFKPVGFSEIEKFPSQVLAHRYPTVRNYGDMTKYKEWSLNEPIDILVGGTPCQSFSVAGLRKGLEDPRGDLMLTYLGIADRLRPRWTVWENVPGVLSSNGGRDFGTFLGALVELGYGFAYRVLDAQWFGVAQRRRCVFVVGCLGDASLAAKVLFESESVCRNPAPSREKRKRVATTLTGGFGERGVDADQIANGNYAVAACLGIAANVAPSLTASNNPSRSPQSSEVTQQVNAILEAQKGSWWDGGQVSQTLDAVLSKGQMMPEKNRFPVVIQPIAFEPGIAAREGNLSRFSTLSPTLRSNAGDNQPAVAFTAAEARRTGTIHGAETVPTLTSQAKGGDTEPCVSYGSQVRRLTPMECERLQGFPDNWTNIRINDKATPDGPRYKAIGNSMAVPVMRWIGERIRAREAALGAL